MNDKEILMSYREKVNAALDVADLYIRQYYSNKKDASSEDSANIEIMRSMRRAIGALMEELEKLKRFKWTPVTDQPPGDGTYQTYLCTLDGELCGIDEPFTGMCGFENGKWDEEDSVIAWMPMPEPYNPYQDN